MNTDADSQNWFALQVRTRWESSTSVLLEGKGYQTFLPTFKLRKSWSGKIREVNAPLFPGYVFCQFDAQKRLPVLVTPGVLAVVGRGRTPIAVDEAEIAAIQNVVLAGIEAEPWPYLELGQKVRIESDPLRGMEGILANFKGRHRIVVSVTLLRRSVALDIDRSCVVPVGASNGPAIKVFGPRPALQSVGA
jgi:transcription antitermination factor NusG